MQPGDTAAAGSVGDGLLSGSEVVVLADHNWLSTAATHSPAAVSVS